MATTPNTSARSGRIRRGWGALVLLTALSVAPAVGQAQETIDQYNAANAEQRRYSDVQNGLNNQALQQQKDQQRQLLGCQGAGAPGACVNDTNITAEQRALRLNNQSIQERNTHILILQSIGVHRVP